MVNWLASAVEVCVAYVVGFSMSFRGSLMLRFSDSFKSYYDRRFCYSRGRAIYVPSLSRVWPLHPARIPIPIPIPILILQFLKSLGSRS